MLDGILEGGVAVGLFVGVETPAGVCLEEGGKPDPKSNGPRLGNRTPGPTGSEQSDRLPGAPQTFSAHAK